MAYGGKGGPSQGPASNNKSIQTPSKQGGVGAATGKMAVGKTPAKTPSDVEKENLTLDTSQPNQKVRRIINIPPKVADLIS